MIPAYTPPARQECSLCATPWYDGHGADCRARVFTEEQLAQALAERLEAPLADAYRQGAVDALSRLKGSLSAEGRELVDGLLADYSE